MIFKINNNRQSIIAYIFKNHIIYKTKNGKIHVHKLPKELIQKKPPLKEAFMCPNRLLSLKLENRSESFLALGFSGNLVALSSTFISANHFETTSSNVGSIPSGLGSLLLITSC